MTSRVEDFFSFARERYQIKLKREAGEPGPWTTDPILQAYRFCNIFREDDKTTRWFRSHITKPLGNDWPRQYMAAVIFRWFNKIETGELLKDLLLGSWDTEEARRRLYRRVSLEKVPILGAAYMIKSPPGMNKVDGLLQCIDAVRERHMDLVAGIFNHQTLQRAHEELVEFPYLGSFMAYEIVTDLRHTPVLWNAKDVDTWAAAGPGAARGLCRVMGVPLGTYRYQSAKDQELLLKGMQRLLAFSRGGLWPAEWPRWEMREVEHTLCEFDKYERARLGEGTPKQRFSLSRGK